LYQLAPDYSITSSSFTPSVTIMSPLSLAT
jgi:hypothetical protein